MSLPRSAGFSVASVWRSARATLPADLAAGTLYGLVMAMAGLSLVALIFSPRELQPMFGLGIRAVLIGTVVMNAIVALTSSYFFATAGPDSNYAALLAASAVGIVAVMGQRQAPAAETGATVLAMLAASGLVVGGVALLLGLLRIGRLARHIPYPVSGGFLAGGGFLVFAGGIRVVISGPLTTQPLEAVAQTPALTLLTALAVGLAMLVLPRLSRHALIMPGIIAGALALFYGGFVVTGLSLEQARVQGMLLRPIAASSALLPPLDLLSLVHWDVVVGQTSALLAVAVVVVLGVSLSAAALELTTQQDADFDRELRANGVANIAAGLVGGMAGGMNSGRTLLLRSSGAATRFAGVWSSLVCLLILLAFEPLLFYFPKPILGGLLLGVGAAYLRDWLWLSYAKLPKPEYALIWAILILIVVFGLVPAVGFGLVVSGLLFVYRYGQTHVIRRSLSSSVHFSKKERATDQVARLKEIGAQARLMTLQGYLFFGTATVVLDACRALVEREGVRFLTLDFRLVQGIDVSAAATFTRLTQICAKAQAKLILTNMSADVVDLLRKSHVIPNPAIDVHSELDRAMEWVEDQLLGPAETSLRDSLAPHFSPEALNVLLPHFEALQLEQGAALFREGDPGNELYFVERGELSAQVQLDNGERLRLRKSGPGTIVGEMALYSRQPRSADVVAEVPSEVLRLTADRLADLERDHPQVAIQFHGFLVKTLSSRLASSTEEVRALV